MGMETSWFGRHKQTVTLVALGGLLLAIFVVLAIFG
jgi:hypothetical protein